MVVDRVVMLLEIMEEHEMAGHEVHEELRLPEVLVVEMVVLVLSELEVVAVFQLVMLVEDELEDDIMEVEEVEVLPQQILPVEEVEEDQVGPMERMLHILRDISMDMVR